MTLEEQAVVDALNDLIVAVAGPSQPEVGGTDDGWVLATAFPGADLGAQINAALDAGYQLISVPGVQGLVIRTTVRLRHAVTIQFNQRYPAYVSCKTKGKPVFEVIGGERHWQIQGGYFNGSAVETPSCFLLSGREGGAAGQCGDTTAMVNVTLEGYWGLGCIINIGGEVLVYERCRLWSSGKGDSLWAGSRATVMLANRDYWGVPYAYEPASQAPGSTSASVFNNCDMRSGSDGSVMLLKGQVEDVTVVPIYMNATGRCGILIEPGEYQGNWGCPRALEVYGGGRFETNGKNEGCPFLVVDGMDRPGMGLYDSSVYRLSMFIGNGQSTITPVFQAERGAQMYAFEFVARHIESKGPLLVHRTADLNRAYIRSRYKGWIDCTGRTMAKCDINIEGTVMGNILSPMGSGYVEVK